MSGYKTEIEIYAGQGGQLCREGSRSFIPAWKEKVSAPGCIVEMANPAGPRFLIDYATRYE